MLGENLWSDTVGPTLGLGGCFNNFGGFSLPLIKNEPMPTPPNSPHGLLDDMELPFTNGDLVDPNAILDVFRSSSASTRSDFFLNDSSFPLDLGDIDVKMEPLEPFLGGDDLHSEYPLEGLSTCMHSPRSKEGDFCPCCVEESFKTEIVNDCMWTSGTAVDPEIKRASNTLSSVMPSIEGGALPPRTHLDSTASRFSDLADLMVGVIPPLEEEEPEIDDDIVESPPPQPPNLETPSESSDTDTDHEEPLKKHPHAQSVYLDHNYYVNRGNSSSIVHPLLRALHKVPTAQTDSDDEIDVVNVSGNDTFDLTAFASGYSGSFSIRESPSPSRSSTSSVVVGGGMKRGRKPLGSGGASTTGRRVGRPCKNVKRLVHSFSNSLPSANPARRYSISVDPQKRNLHNSMERMRRVNLRNCFDAVRSAVPSLRDRTRAPKVLILKSALDLIHNLEMGEVRKKAEAEQLRLYQAGLMVKLQNLKDERGMG